MGGIKNRDAKRAAAKVFRCEQATACGGRARVCVLPGRTQQCTQLPAPCASMRARRIRTAAASSRLPLRRAPRSSGGGGGGTKGPALLDKRGEELPCPHCDRVFKQVGWTWRLAGW